MFILILTAGFLYEVVQGALRFALNSSYLALPPQLSVSTDVSKGVVCFKGPHGSSFYQLPAGVSLAIVESLSSPRTLRVTCDPALTLASSQRCAQQRFVSRKGLIRTYQARLRLVGVGFRASNTGNGGLSLRLGRSHTVEVSPSSFVKVSAAQAKGSLISIVGISPSDVNRCAHNIRALRLPDPYKGKGILYDGENVKLRRGKRSSTLFRYMSTVALTPRYRLSYVTTNKIWPTKNGRLRGFYGIRSRRFRRGGLFRRYVRVRTTRKWAVARRRFHPEGLGHTDPKRVSRLRYRDAFYRKQQLRAFGGKLSETTFRSLYARQVGQQKRQGDALRLGRETRLDRVLFRRRVLPTIFACQQLIHHQGVHLSSASCSPTYTGSLGTLVSSRRLETSPGARVIPGDEISLPFHV